MLLSQLDPRWFVLETKGLRVGLTFECPHCQRIRLGVSFHHQGQEVIEDQYIHAKSPGTNHIWTLTGDSFENVTLTPSIDASESGHWHGFITNGQIVGGV